LQVKVELFRNRSSEDEVTAQVDYANSSAFVVVVSKQSRILLISIQRPGVCALGDAVWSRHSKLPLRLLIGDKAPTSSP
jgi:hypothetical protein